METHVHERFVCGTTTLHDYLIKLGYEVKEEGRGISKVRTYTLDNKEVVDTHNNVTLFTRIPGNKRPYEYRGYTISKDLLTFFSQRQRTEVKNNDTNI